MMNPVYSIGRAGATAMVDGVSAPSAAQRSGGVSFGKSLEYVIDANRADQTQYVGGIGEQIANTQQTSQQRKSLPLGPRVTVNGSTNANSASGIIPQRSPVATEPQSQHGDSTRVGIGTAAGSSQPDTLFSTLDPRSMAFLLAWMGGGGDGQSIQQQQQNYLEFYRQHYPNGVPGGNGPVSATLNFLTGTS